MLPSIFIIVQVFITIFFANCANAIMCYRGPLNFESSSFLKELKEFDCSNLNRNTVSLLSVCLLALECNVNPGDEELFNLAARGVRKIYEADCVKKITPFGPSAGIRYTPEEMCEKYYTGQRGCKSCKICYTDYCNKFPFPSAEAVIYANGANNTWENADDKNSSDYDANNALDGALHPLSFFMFFMLSFAICMIKCYLV